MGGEQQINGYTPLAPHAGRGERFADLLTVLSLLFFILVMVLASSLLVPRANAQTAALADDPATLAEKAATVENQSPFLYQGQVVVETVRSANEAEIANYSGLYELTASAVHKRTAIVLTGRLRYSQQYSYANDDGSTGMFENPRVSAAKSFRRGKEFDFDWLDAISVSVSGTLGANAESQRRHFRWANGVSVTGAKDFGRLALRQGLGYSYSFYEYDIRSNGVVNSPNAFSSSTLAFYSLSDNFSFGGGFFYTYAVSFQGVGRGVASGTLSADYSLSNRVALSLGVASEASALTPDGLSYDVRLYAPESAQYYFDVIVSL